MQSKKIKLFIITGFLGSGKTTLLKKIIEITRQNKIGIIMNEFGKISIDGKLVEGEDHDVIEINNGSIFCSCLKGSFAKALITFSKFPIDYLFVESSGLSDPSNIIEILEIVDKQTDNAYDYRGSLCVVDGVHFLKLLPALPTLEKQIVASDFILINKVDLLSSEQENEIETKILDLNSHAEVVKSKFCNISEAALNSISNSKNIQNEESYNTPHNRPKTLTLKADGVFALSELHEFLKSLSNDLYRAKGFFLLREGWHQIDMVGQQIDIVPVDFEYEASTLVLISSSGLAAIRKIAHMWESIFKEKMILK